MMAISETTPSRASVLAPALPFDLDLRWVWRAHVLPATSWRYPERTLYLEAATERSAHERMVLAIAAIDRCTSQQAAERIYNVTAAQELVETGLSADPLLRVFETGWAGDQATCFVEHPLILLEVPAALLVAWARISREVRP